MEDSWVDAEIERELNALSIKDLENQEGGGDGSAILTPGRSESGETQAVEAEGGVDVSSLFNGYLASLQCEHQGVEALMSDAKDTLDGLHKASVDVVHEHSSSESGSALQTSVEQTPSEGSETGSNGLLQPTSSATGVTAPDPSVGLPLEATSEDVCSQSDEVDQVCVEPTPACEINDSVSPAGPQLMGEAQRLKELEQEQAEKQKALDVLIAESERKKQERNKLLVDRAALEAARRLEAAVMLQAGWRGHTARRLCEPLLAELRERRAKKMEATRHSASIVLQANWRGYSQRKRCKAEARERRIRLVAESKAAVVLQSHWRARMARMKLRALKVKHRKAAEEAEVKVHAAVCIQKHWKGCLMRRKFRRKLRDLKQQKLEQEQLFQLRLTQEKHRAATCIQTHWRRRIARTAYLKQLEKLRNEKRDMQSDQKLSPVVSLASIANAQSSLGTTAHGAEDQSETASSQQSNFTTPPSSQPSNFTTPSSPGKLTIAKRISSALKLLKHSSEVGFSDKPSENPKRSIQSSSLPLIRASPERQRNRDVEESTDEEDERDAELAQEEKAMQLLAEGREREELIAQLSRERMEKMISAEEVAQVARTKRSYVTYRQELEHASVPMSPFAWAGLIEEKWMEWRKDHSTWMWPCSSSRKQPPATTATKPKRTPAAGSKALSSAQLRATSAKGTSLTEVANVMVHRSRAPVDLTSLSQCPLLHCLWLTKCGVTFLCGLSDCKCLVDVSMTSNTMDHIDCSGIPQLLFLDLADNRLASIHGLDACATLLEFNLAENRIARIAGVKGCSRLQKLTVDGNLIINCKGLEDLPMLQCFSCAENHLPRVQGLQSCSLLQTLNLSQNNLQEIPSLPNHVLLRELCLSENSLSDLSPVTSAWLPLLQTLTLANNCITEMGSLSCLIMLERLDLSNNSLHDLPVLLQSIKACFRLKEIHLHGNPITEEPRYRSYLIKAVPHLEKLNDQVLTNRKAVKLPEAVASSRLMQLCTRQLAEQDELRSKHQQETEAVAPEDLANPQTAIRLVKSKAAFCFAYERLLISHLREHEAFEPQQREGRQAAADGRRRRPPPGPSLQSIRAAIVLQKVWRGRRGRELVALRRKQFNHAATVIQANFRGYRLRKRLRAALQHIQQQADTAAAAAELSSEGGEEFDYEKEVKLDYLDESLLDAELGPLSPPPTELLQHLSTGLYHHGRQAGEEEEKGEIMAARSERVVNVVVPEYGIPGAVDCEIGIDVWRQREREDQKQRPHHHQFKPLQQATSREDRKQDYQQGDDSSSILHSERSEPCETSDLQHPSPLKVQLAWGTSTVELNEEEEGEEVVEEEGGSSCEKLEVQQSDAGRSSKVQSGSAKKEAISSEWGFKSSATADLMLKRAKRQKKLKAAAVKRKKLTDPEERLALFRKQESGSGLLKAALGRSAPVAAPQRQAYLPHGHDILQQPPVYPPQSRRPTKEDSLYRWVHTATAQLQAVHSSAPPTSVARELRLQEDAARSKPKHQQSWHAPKASSGVLPQLEPHVLAGHAPRLVSSEAQNLLIGSSSSSSFIHKDQRLPQRERSAKKPF